MTRLSRRRATGPAPRRPQGRATRPPEVAADQAAHTSGQGGGAGRDADGGAHGHGPHAAARAGRRRMPKSTRSSRAVRHPAPTAASSTDQRPAAPRTRRRARRRGKADAEADDQPRRATDKPDPTTSPCRVQERRTGRAKLLPRRPRPPPRTSPLRRARTPSRRRSRRTRWTRWAWATRSADCSAAGRQTAPARLRRADHGESDSRPDDVGTRAGPAADRQAARPARRATAVQGTTRQGRRQGRHRQAARTAAREPPTPSKAAAGARRRRTTRLRRRQPALSLPDADAEALADANTEPGIPLLPDDPWTLKSTQAHPARPGLPRHRQGADRQRHGQEGPEVHRHRRGHRRPAPDRGRPATGTRPRAGPPRAPRPRSATAR